jgi:hypothetical protein
MSSQPVLKKILKGILHKEEEDKCNQDNRGKNKPQ